jgi:alpha-acetolactate decarboxylase
MAHVNRSRHRPVVTAAVVGVLACVAAIVTAAQAQHARPPEHSAPARTAAPNAALRQGPFGVRAYGKFRDMAQGQDYQPKAKLGDVKAEGATDAVGALSGLRGEITMLDGRFIVSYGDGCTACPPPHAETATLLATGKVAEWTAPIVLPESLAGKALEHFIVARAKAAGLDMSIPFPVRLKGTLTDVSMHVLKAPNAKFTGHGSAHPMAALDEIKAAALAGEVIGFFAPPALAGVISHPGEPFHFHWVDEARSKTAHIDAFGMAKGAVLSLPKP